MEASWKRADAVQKKHQEKEEERARKEANRAALLAPSEEKKKYEKKISSTAEVRQRRNRAPQAGDDAAEEEEPARQLVVRKDDGSEITYAQAVGTTPGDGILAFLQEHEQEVSITELRRKLGIDLHQQNNEILDKLESHPRIVRINQNGECRLQYEPPRGIRNRGALAYELTNAGPSSYSVEQRCDRHPPVLRSELKPDETYPGVEVDIDELLAEGLVARVEHSDKKHSEFVLFAMPPGLPAIEEVRELWRRERVPQGPALQDDLLKRKLLTKEQLDKRKKRKEAERKAAAEASKSAKRDRTGTIRTWKNTHLGNADELGEIFKR